MLRQFKKHLLASGSFIVRESSNSNSDRRRKLAGRTLAKVTFHWTKFFNATRVLH